MERQKDVDIESLFARIDKIRPSDIFRLTGIGLEKVRQVGEGHYKCLCPFPQHGMDKKVGSFDINDNKGIARCFACNCGGRPVSIFRDLFGYQDNYTAGIILGRLAGFISSDDEERLLRAHDDKPVVARKIIKRTEKKKQTKPEQKLQPVEVRSAFYEALVKRLPLLPEDRAYLVRERHIKDCSDFFSYKFSKAKAKKIMDSIMDELGWPKEQFIGIPGVYEVNADGPSYLTITTRSNKCIGIVHRNLDGKIENLQFRNYKANQDGGRYFWLSSGFACSDDRPLWSNGTTGVIAVGYEHGKGQGNHRLAYTEGKFKAMALAEHGYNAFSIQGVNNWKAGLDVAKKYLEKYPECSKKAYLVFDADQKFNPAVAKATKRFANGLVELGYRVFILDWDIECGKGIDDVLNAGYGEKVRSVNCGKFISQYIDPLIRHVEEEAGKRRKNLAENFSGFEITAYNKQNR